MPIFKIGRGPMSAAASLVASAIRAGRSLASAAEAQPPGGNPSGPDLSLIKVEVNVVGRRKRPSSPSQGQERPQ